MKHFFILITFLAFGFKAGAQVANPNPLPQGTTTQQGGAEANSAISTDEIATQTSEFYANTHAFIYNSASNNVVFRIYTSANSYHDYDLKAFHPIDISITASNTTFSIRSADNSLFTLPIQAGKHYNIVFFNQRWQLQEE